MNKTAKIIIFILFSSGLLHSEPKQLTNFIQVFEALKSGYSGYFDNVVVEEL